MSINDAYNRYLDAPWIQDIERADTTTGGAGTTWMVISSSKPARRQLLHGLRPHYGHFLARGDNGKASALPDDW